MGAGLAVALLAVVSGYPSINGTPAHGSDFDVRPSHVVWTDDGELTTRVELLARSGGTFAIWYTIARSGAEDRWKNFEYHSERQEVRVAPGIEATVAWDDWIPLGSGVYVQDFWIERRSGEEFLSIGGTVGETLRRSAERVTAYQTRGDSPIEVGLSVIADDTEKTAYSALVTCKLCPTTVVLNWTLQQRDVIAYSSLPQRVILPPEGATVELVMPTSIEPGVYDLSVVARIESTDAPEQVSRLKNALAIRHPPAFIRRTEPVGPYVWELSAIPEPLKSGTEVQLSSLTVSSVSSAPCRTFWRLTDGTATPITSGSSTCSKPNLQLPTLPAGTYLLELSAYVQTSDSQGGSLSDSITLPITIAQ